jgi:hypothetical protein
MAHSCKLYLEKEKCAQQVFLGSLTKVLTGDDMLFSIYASFRWARKRHYVLKIGVFGSVKSLVKASP